MSNFFIDIIYFLHMSYRYIFLQIYPSNKSVIEKKIFSYFVNNYVFTIWFPFFNESQFFILFYRDGKKKILIAKGLYCRRPLEYNSMAGLFKLIFYYCHLKQFLENGQIFFFFFEMVIINFQFFQFKYFCGTPFQ